MKKRYTEEKIIILLNEQESGIKIEDFCRKYNIGYSTFHKWKSKYSGMEANEAKRLRELEAENIELKRLLENAMIDNIALALKDVISIKR
jgi:putative transposase